VDGAWLATRGKVVIERVGCEHRTVVGEVVGLGIGREQSFGDGRWSAEEEPMPELVRELRVHVRPYDARRDDVEHRQTSDRGRMVQREPIRHRPPRS